MNRFTLTIALVLAAGALPAQEKSPEQPKINFPSTCSRFFASTVLNATTPTKPRAVWRSIALRRLMEGGGSGEIVSDGDAEGSRLYQLMTHEDTPEMPPNQDPLPKEQLDIIKQWINGGLLENSGSKAKKEAGPSLPFTSLDAAASPRRSRCPKRSGGCPVVVIPACSGGVGHCCQSLGTLGRRWRSKASCSLYNTDTAELVGIIPYPGRHSSGCAVQLGWRLPGGRRRDAWLERRRRCLRRQNR